MKKEYFYVIILCICIILVGIGILGLLSTAHQFQEQVEEDFGVVENTVKEEKIVATAVEEKKVSPNSNFALKKYYDECNHFEYEEARASN